MNIMRVWYEIIRTEFSRLLYSLDECDNNNRTRSAARSAVFLSHIRSFTTRRKNVKLVVLSSGFCRRGGTLVMSLSVG